MFTFLSTGDNCGNVYMNCEIISIEIDDDFAYIPYNDEDNCQLRELRVLIQYGNMYSLTVTKKYLTKDLNANYVNELITVIEKINNNYIQMSQATMLEEIEKVILRKNLYKLTEN